MKYQEIMKNAGILQLNGEVTYLLCSLFSCSCFYHKFCYLQKRHVDISELESLGELGHGTCGHVVKMRHKATNTYMAVKVRSRSCDSVIGHFVCTVNLPFGSKCDVPAIRKRTNVSSWIWMLYSSHIAARTLCFV